MRVFKSPLDECRPSGISARDLKLIATLTSAALMLAQKAAEAEEPDEFLSRPLNGFCGDTRTFLAHYLPQQSALHIEEDVQCTAAKH